MTGNFEMSCNIVFRLKTIHGHEVPTLDIQYEEVDDMNE